MILTKELEELQKKDFLSYIKKMQELCNEERKEELEIMNRKNEMYQNNREREELRFLRDFEANKSKRRAKNERKNS